MKTKKKTIGLTEEEIEEAERVRDHYDKNENKTREHKNSDKA